MKHQLTLVRDTNDNAIYRKAAAAAGIITLDKISRFVHHVLPNDSYKMALYKTIESKTFLPAAYRMRQTESIAVPETKEIDQQVISRKTAIYYTRISNGPKW